MTTPAAAANAYFTAAAAAENAAWAALQAAPRYTTMRADAEASYQAAASEWATELAAFED